MYPRPGVLHTDWAMMSLHWCWENVVAMSRYLSFQRITCLNPNLAAACITFAVAIADCHCLAYFWIYLNSALLLPSGASWMPSVQHASDAANCRIVTGFPESSGTWSWCWLDGGLYVQQLWCQIGWIRYQKHLSGMSALPVAWSNPVHSCRPCIWRCNAEVDIVHKAKPH